MIVKKSVWEKSARAVFVLFLVWVPLAFLSRKVFIPPEVHYVQLFTSVKEVTARLFTLLLCLFFVIQIVFLKKPIIKTPLYLPLFLLWIYQGISLFWTENPYQGMEHWIRWGMLFLFFIICFNQIKREDIPKYMAVSTIPAFLICLIGAIEYFFPLDFSFFKYRDFPWAAVFSTHKLAGEYLLPFIFWTPALYFSRKEEEKPSLSFRAEGEESLFKKIYPFLTFFFIFSLFFIFQSRSAIAALFVLMPFLIFREREKLKFMQKKALTIVLVSVVGALLLILCSPPGKRAINNVKSIVDTNFTGNTQRFVMWKNTARMISDHPLLGVGIGNFNLIYHHYVTPDDRYQIPENWDYYYLRQAHNEYLEIFSELGIVGIFLFFIFLGLILTSSMLYLRKNRDDAIFFGLFLSFLGSLIIAFFVFNFQTAPTSYFFIATIVFLLKWMKTEEKILKIKSIYLRILIPFLFLGGTVLFLKPLVRVVFVDYYRRLGQSVLESTSPRKSDKRAVEILKKGFSWNPNDWEIHFLMANAYGDRGLYTQAIEHTKKSFQLNPTHILTLYNMGIYYERMGNDETALKTYEEILKKTPDFKRVSNRMGYLSLKEGKMIEANRYFKKTLLPAAYQELEVTEALRGLVYCDIKVGKNERAMSYLLETFLSEAASKKTRDGYFLKEKTFTPLFQWWLTKQ